MDNIFKINSSKSLQNAVLLSYGISSSYYINNDNYQSYLLIGSAAGQSSNEVISFSSSTGDCFTIYDKKIQKGDFNRLAIAIVTGYSIGTTITVSGQYVTNTAILGLK